MMSVEVISLRIYAVKMMSFIQKVSTLSKEIFTKEKVPMKAVTH